MSVITQEIINTLAKDACELHKYGDMFEVLEFIEELCNKYKLVFPEHLIRGYDNE